MSDMSLPLSLVPLAPEGSAPITPFAPIAPTAISAAAPSRPATEPFAWPTPPTPGYPAPSCQTEPEACEIEGPNGKVSAGRLSHFDAEAGLVHLLLASSRGTLTLKLTQFRRLTLTRPLPPLAPPAGTAFDATTPLLPHRTQVNVALCFKDGQTSRHDSIGRVETPLGLFTFTPLDAVGNVLRNFYPRAMLAPVAFSPRIGDVLLAQQATTPVQLDAAAAEQTQLRSRKLGDLLLTEQIVTPAQLLAAIDQQAKMPMVRIGEALLALGYLTEAKLAEALQLQSRDRSLPLGELLVRRGDVSRADLQTALARKMGYPIVEVNAFPVEAEGVLRLPISAARRLLALPLMMRGGRLVVALEDPSARNAIDEIEFSAQCKVLPVLAHAGSLAAAIDRIYLRLGKDSIDPGEDLSGPLKLSDPDSHDSANKLLANLEQQQHGPASRDDETPIEQSDNSLVRLINTTILEAQQQGVSDIHIECQPGVEKVRIRFRRDGVLRPYIELPATYRSAMVARIKIMCDLDISERRKPQDGKINFGRWVQGQKLELRVATIPTANGLEDVVMRLLASAKVLPLEAMSLHPDTLAKLKRVIERPYGMVLCVGPTGSGKTTTLHAALGHINTPERKIWTAEDPVEITQAGLRQVQVNPKIEWTFAKALRAFLRADPDVVMVGEIRDRETAQMAVEASLTGHLVLSTLHTNSAPETVTRLLDMGMDPFSFADSLLAVLAQRLVRRWCKHCVTSRPASLEDIQALLDEYLLSYPDPTQGPDRKTLLDEWTHHYGQDGVLHQAHAPGCAHCGQSGFASRIGLHELLVVSRELRHLIQTSARAEELQRAAMNEGMRTLRQDGIHKVLAGLTAIEEVRAISNS
jgi:type II secretory ATPase GspE/PulE/Tfp pilus assembly ATPase PilB-like protein